MKTLSCITRERYVVQRLRHRQIVFDERLDHEPDARCVFAEQARYTHEVGEGLTLLARLQLNDDDAICMVRVLERFSTDGT